MLNVALVDMTVGQDEVDGGSAKVSVGQRVGRRVREEVSWDVVLRC